MQILITGASSGIGREAAKQLVASGHSVIGTSRNPDAIVDPVPGVRYLRLEQTDSESIAELVAAAGDIDVLVNNAGQSMVGPAEDTPIEAFEELYRANVFGPIELSQAVLPGMRARGGGRIIMIGSMLGSFPLAFRSGYGSAKAALHYWAVAASREFAPHGVSICVVEPGTINTGIEERRIFTVRPDSAYLADYERVAAKTQKAAENGMPTGEFVDELIRAIVDAKPKLVYAKGNRAPLPQLLKRILGEELMYKVTCRAHGLR